MSMNYQIELKIHGQLYDLKSTDADFSIFLYRKILEDFKVEENNTRIGTLHVYVKVCHQLFLQEQTVQNLTHKIESLI